MARYLRKVTDNSITIVADDDDDTWHTLLAQNTSGADVPANSSPKPLYEQTSEAWVLQHGGSSSLPAESGGDRLRIDKAAYTLDGGDIDWSTFTVQEQVGGIAVDGSHINLEEAGVYAVTLRMACAASWLDSTKVVNDLYSLSGPWEIIDEFPKSDVQSFYALTGVWWFDAGESLVLNAFGNGNTPLPMRITVLTIRL